MPKRRVTAKRRVAVRGVGTRTVRVSRRKHLKGAGFMDVMKKIGGFLKDSKIISTVAGLIPHPAAQGVARVAGAVGLGRRRRPARRLHGRGSMVLPNVHSMHALAL